MSSSVVALHTALANPCPAKECFAANIRSFRVCPPIGAAILGLYNLITPTKSQFKVLTGFTIIQHYVGHIFAIRLYVLA